MVKKYGLLLSVILTSVILITSCSSNNSMENAEKVEKELFSMDTYITLTAYGENAQTAVDLAEKRIEEINALLSTGDEASEIYLVNKNNGGVLTDDAAYLLGRSIELYKKTNGIFDITIYPLMEKWGFTDKNYRIPSDEEIKKILPLVNSDNILYDNETSEIFFDKDGMKIDFGGIAKGYTSSEIMRIYEEQGVKSGIVNLGGNVHTLGTKPDGSQWKVAIQNPDKSKDFLGILEASDKAVISSGDYERFFIKDGVKYHHIMDTSTGKPADSNLQSVTIVSDDGTLADGLSTSLYVMGKEKAIEFWRENSDEFQIILFTKDEGLYVSEGLKKDFSSDLYDIQIISEK